MKDKLAATLLAFFLGSFGVHRFYLRQTGLGILYLATCWSGIPTIISFIDAFFFLIRDEDTFNEKYNAKFLAKQKNKSGNSVANELEKLFNLKERGAISEREYKQKKSELINS